MMKASNSRAGTTYESTIQNISGESGGYCLNLVEQYTLVPQYFDELRTNHALKSKHFDRTLYYLSQYSCQGNCGSFDECPTGIMVKVRTDDGSVYHYCGEVIKLINGRPLHKRKEGIHAPDAIAY